MQPLAPDVLGISKTPWVFGQLVNSRRFFSKPDNLFFYIHGNLGKHLKWFGHKLGRHWWGLEPNKVEIPKITCLSLDSACLSRAVDALDVFIIFGWHCIWMTPLHVIHIPPHVMYTHSPEMSYILFPLSYTFLPMTYTARTPPSTLYYILLDSPHVITHTRAPLWLHVMHKHSFCQIQQISMKSMSTSRCYRPYTVLLI